MVTGPSPMMGRIALLLALIHSAESVRVAGDCKGTKVPNSAEACSQIKDAVRSWLVWRWLASRCNLLPIVISQVKLQGRYAHIEWSPRCHCHSLLRDWRPRLWIPHVASKRWIQGRRELAKLDVRQKARKDGLLQQED
eukprot:s1640_g13.t1